MTMSSRRKRANGITAETNIATPTSVKRKKCGRVGFAEKERRENESRKIEYALEKLRSKRNDKKESILSNFIRLPSRRIDPEFYEKVENPIDIAKIQTKHKTAEYMDYQEFSDDIDLLVNNCLSYYKEGSDEYNDAQLVQKEFIAATEKVDSGEYQNSDVDSNGSEDENEDVEDEEIKEESESEDDRERTPFEIDLHIIHDMIGSVLEYTDKTGRLLCPPFRVLLPKEEFPVYYEKVSNPIDLKTIAIKGRNGEYSVMKQILDDLILLFNNAQLYSGEGSHIYDDAETLKKFVKEKARKVEEKGHCHPKRREKVQRFVDGLLTQNPSLNDYENFSEDSEEDEDSEKDQNPLWILYWKIRNSTNENDRSMSLSDHFLELPSRVCYPDYYDEIKRPISLFMINKKLKKGNYDMKHLVKDMLQMFDNACEYNMETSDVYIASKKLKQLTIDTVKEIAPDIDLKDFENDPLKAKVKIDMDTDSETNGRTPPPSAKRRSPKKGGKPGRKSMAELNEIARTKHIMLTLWTNVYNFKTGPDRSYWPAGAFLDLPSSKDYPEYYEVIKKPIDMKMIRDKIEGNGYKTVFEMMDDMKLLFNNARAFNEPGSNIYQDADTLENILMQCFEHCKNMKLEGINVQSTPNTSASSQYRLKLNVRSEKRSVKRKPKVEASDDEESRRGRRPVKRTDDSVPRLSEEEQKMWRLFDTMYNLREEGSNRLLAESFYKLPSKEEMPVYYDVIKRPMDLNRIKNRLMTKSYLTIGDVYSDFSLMLTNACKYNETESRIFKDAVALQKVLLELKSDLDRDEKSPRVQLELRTIFTSVFASIFAKKDANGMSYADQFVDLIDLLKSKGVPSEEWPFTFDQIKMNIDKCRYRRLDRFQQDFFNLFEKARELSKPGSPMYDASIVLQRLFIVERDLKCRPRIKSNAYSVLEKDILEEIEKTAAIRAKEEDEEGAAGLGTIKRNESEVDLDEFEIRGTKYVVPCFAYVSRMDERKLPNHLFRINRIFKDENGDIALQGLWVYHPHETIHFASRKFHEREVFVTKFVDTIMASRLRGLCYVLSHNSFSNKVVKNVDEKDVYFCEFKYHGKPKYFGKFRSWPYGGDEEKLEMEQRKSPISLKRDCRAMKEDSQDGDARASPNESEDEDENDRARSEMVLDIERFETMTTTNTEPGRTYFQQIKSKTGKFYIIGQHVLVFNPKKPLCDVMRINKLWRDEDGLEWFSGCWFARPIEVIHDRTAMFYPREVIAVYREDETRPLCDVQNWCDVMPAKEYSRCRQTDIAECDVFVCEWQVNGSAVPPQNCSLFEYQAADISFGPTIMNLDYAKRCLKFKKYKLIHSIPNEELLYFKTPIIMEKEISPILKNEGSVPLDQLDELMDDDTDGSESVASSNINPPSTTAPTPKPESGETATPQPPSTPVPPPATTNSTVVPSAPSTPIATTANAYPATPASTSVVNTVPSLPTPRASKSKSGYILFSAEVRKRIMHENPEAGFGEVSKIVGIEWKKLSDEQKKHYEIRAEAFAQEKAKQDAIKAAQERNLQPGQFRIFQCKWSNCDSQFDDENALSEHIIQHHTSQIIIDSDQQVVCMWGTCLRNRKDGKPFPSLPRLQRHIKEKHIPASSRIVMQNQIGKNFFKYIPVVDAATNKPTGNYQLVNAPYGRWPPPQMVQQERPNGMNGHAPGTPMTNGVMHVQQNQMVHQQQSQMVQQYPQNSMHHQAPQQNGIYVQQGPSNVPYVNGQPQHQSGMVPQQHQMQQQQQPHPQQHAQHQQQPQQPPHQQQQHPQQQHQQQQQNQQVIVDPGRTIVRAQSHAPTFVAPPNSIHSRRVLHSEAYLKYIESMSTNRQKSVSRWEKSLGACHRAVHANGNAKLPGHWLKKTDNGHREEDVTKALWKLRDELLKSTCNVVMERE